MNLVGSDDAYVMLMLMLILFMMVMIIIDPLPVSTVFIETQFRVSCRNIKAVNLKGEEKKRKQNATKCSPISLSKHLPHAESQSRHPHQSYSSSRSTRLLAKAPHARPPP